VDVRLAVADHPGAEHDDGVGRSARIASHQGIDQSIRKPRVVDEDNGEEDAEDAGEVRGDAGT
jgi:hypothetical protein